MKPEKHPDESTGGVCDRGLRPFKDSQPHGLAAQHSGGRAQWPSSGVRTHQTDLFTKPFIDEQAKTMD